jgi:hypothetical protein
MEGPWLNLTHGCCGKARKYGKRSVLSLCSFAKLDKQVLNVI